MLLCQITEETGTQTGQFAAGYFATQYLGATSNQADSASMITTKTFFYITYKRLVPQCVATATKRLETTKIQKVD